MSLLEEIIRKNILKEQKFHEINKEITFDFNLYHDEYGHTQVRKWRHGSENKISDYDIVKLLNNATDQIIYNIIDGYIRHNRRFIVSRERGDNLNVVVQPEKLESTKWNLIIVTVMKKSDFNVGKGQLQIFV
jgi:hypothetical protein